MLSGRETDSSAGFAAPGLSQLLMDVRSSYNRIHAKGAIYGPLTSRQGLSYPRREVSV